MKDHKEECGLKLSHKIHLTEPSNFVHQPQEKGIVLLYSEN